jgi:hypothetical protein
MMTAQATALTTAQTPQVPIPTGAAEVPTSVPGNRIAKEYVQMLGRMAYVGVSDGQCSQSPCGLLDVA